MTASPTASGTAGIDVFKAFRMPMAATRMATCRKPPSDSPSKLLEILYGFWGESLGRLW